MDPDAPNEELDDELEEDELEEAPADGDADDGQPSQGPTPRRHPAVGASLLIAALACWGVVAYLKTDVGRGSLKSLAVVDEGEPAGEPEAPADPEPAIAPDEAAPAAEPVAPEPAEPEPTKWVKQEWAEGVEPPDVVKYKIRYGGTLRKVANLFKIFHHEIEALNPGVGIDKQLSPGTPVVVYRRSGDELSESVGYPGVGSLHGAVPLMDGPGRTLKMIPWKSWATAHTVMTLDRALNQWAERFPEEQTVLVGNMSSREGGKLQPHSSHQSGRDVDLGYMQRGKVLEEHNWRKMNADNLDAGLTWELLKLLVETGGVEVIFIDKSIQELLHAWAVKHKPVPAGELSRWLQHPRGSGRALIQHVPGHVDHMHVRFACPPGQERCKTRGLDTNG